MVFIIKKWFLCLYRLALTLCFIVVAVQFASCKHRDIANVNTSFENQRLVYSKGIRYLQEGKFLESDRKFQWIVDNIPIFGVKRKAIFMSAVVKFREGKYEQAALIGIDYIKRYPLSQDIDYMYYLIGVSYANMIRNVPYDQKYTDNMIEYMSAIVKSYPRSKYLKSAQAYINLGINQLAAQEMNIGRYYLNNKEYVSAVTRFQFIVTQYPGTEQVEEALARLIEAYSMLGLIDEAKNVFSIIQNKYPQGYWFKYVENLMESYKTS